MEKIRENIAAISESTPLYCQAVALYDKIERENAHTAEVNGITLSYLEFGEKNAVPLIWAHGSGSNRYELFNVQAGLVKAGYRVISIDYRGHGKTQIEITDYNTSLYHIADDIAALMDQLHIDKAIIGGLSKGGWVTAAFYDTYPDRVLGLLLEDGGSFSGIRLADDTKLNVVQPGPMPYPVEACNRLHKATGFESRLEGVQAMLAVFLPAISVGISTEYIAGILASLRQKANGRWVYHCDSLRLMTSHEAGRNLGSEISGTTLYSRLPLMQQSQELMNPFVVFRNLHVPMHIIDPDSPTDWMPVRHQNEELQKLHPDLIVHEVYDYEHSPHEAHIERPERFIESAKMLLAQVKLHTQ